MNSNTRPAVSRYQGFSLVELMIAMVIGLILLAGVGTVFISTQQTSQTKRALDNAQETLRYTHQSISRMVRIGEIDVASDGSELIIIFNRSDATPDCLGGTGEDDGVEVVYSLHPDRPELECSVDGGAPQVLARNITAFSVQYESLDGEDWISTNGTDAVSVRVALTFRDPTVGDLIATSFVATSRKQVIEGYVAGP